MEPADTTAPPRSEVANEHANQSSGAGILKNISWLGASSMLVKPLWFIFVTAFCMRVLEASGYGVMNNALALMMMFVPFADLGTGQLIIRDVARSRSQAPDYFANLLLARLALAVPAFLLAILVGWSLGYDSGEMWAIAFAGLYAFSLRQMEFCRSFYRAFEILRYEAVSLVVEKALVIGLGVALLLLLRTPSGTLAGMGIGLAMAVALNLLWIHHKVAGFSFGSLDFSFLKGAFRTALPLGVVILLTMMYLRIGGIILEAVQGEAPAGQYYAAFRIVEALQVLPTIVVAAVLPRLSALFHQRALSSFKRILRRSLLSTAAITLPVAAGLTIFGPDVIRLLDPSPDFSSAGEVLRLIVWAFPLMTANNIVVVALIASDEQRYLAMVMFGVLLVNAAVSYVLVQTASYFGAAIGLLVSELFVLVAASLRQRHALRRRAEEIAAVNSDEVSAINTQRAS